MLVSTNCHVLSTQTLTHTHTTAEAKILAQLPPHPNVIALYGVCLWPATNTVRVYVCLYVMSYF